MLELFIQNGSEVNKKNDVNLTPLHNLFYNKNPNQKNIEYLLENKADPNSLDENKKSFPYLVIKNKLPEDVQLNLLSLLFQHNADPNIKHKKNAIFHLALLKKSTKILQFLIDNGVDINKEDKDGVSPLEYVISNKDLKKFLFLLRFPQLDFNSCKLEVEDNIFFHIMEDILIDKAPIWNPERHQYFPRNVRETVETFTICLKAKSFEIHKIPKPIFYLIINLFVLYCK